LVRDFAVQIFVSFNDCSVDQLLKLNIVQILADHHLEHLEELTIGNEAIVVNVVDLESESEFLVLSGMRTQRIEALNELEERNAPILILVKHSNNTLD
jgi:hypothetical protein